jgi:hypothetical protein
MQQQIAKLRNVFGEAHKDEFDGIKPSEAITEGSIVDVNNHFIAVS